jgi:hypothetical protein
MEKTTKFVLLATVLFSCGSLTVAAEEGHPAIGGLESAPARVEASLAQSDFLDMLQAPQNKYACPEPQCSTVSDCDWLTCPADRELVCRNICGFGQCECQLIWWP